MAADDDASVPAMRGVEDALALVTALLDVTVQAGGDLDRRETAGAELLYPMILELYEDPSSGLRIGCAVVALLYMVQGMIQAKAGPDVAAQLRALQELAIELTSDGP